jgi:hypothetical protein
MFICDKKYSTRWTFVLRVTSDEKLTKVHRTRELSPYANSHEWHFAKHIALVCAGLNIQLNMNILQLICSSWNVLWLACRLIITSYCYKYFPFIFSENFDKRFFVDSYIFCIHIYFLLIFSLVIINMILHCFLLLLMNLLIMHG